MWLIKQLKQQIRAYNFSKHKKSCSQPKFLVKLFACLLLVGNCVCAGELVLKKCDASIKEINVMVALKSYITTLAELNESITFLQQEVTSSEFYISKANNNTRAPEAAKILAGKLVGDNAIKGAVTEKNLKNLAIIAASITDAVAKIEETGHQGQELSDIKNLKNTSFQNITEAIEPLAKLTSIFKEGTSTYLNNLSAAAKLTPSLADNVAIKEASNTYAVFKDIADIYQKMKFIKNKSEEKVAIEEFKNHVTQGFNLDDKNDKNKDAPAVLKALAGKLDLITTDASLTTALVDLSIITGSLTTAVGNITDKDLKKEDFDNIIAAINILDNKDLIEKITEASQTEYLNNLYAAAKKTPTLADDAAIKLAAREAGITWDYSVFNDIADINSKMEQITNRDELKVAIYKFKKIATTDGSITEKNLVSENKDATAVLEELAGKLNLVTDDKKPEDLKNLAIIAASLTTVVAKIPDEDLKKENFDKITVAIEKLATEDIIANINIPTEREDYIKILSEAANKTPSLADQMAIRVATIATGDYSDDYAVFKNIADINKKIEYIKNAPELKVAIDKVKEYITADGFNNYSSCLRNPDNKEATKVLRELAGKLKLVTDDKKLEALKKDLKQIAGSLTTAVAKITGDEDLKSTYVNNITAANQLLNAANRTPSNALLGADPTPGDYSGDSEGYCYLTSGKSTRHSADIKGVIKGETYKKDDLTNGRITIDPQTMDTSGSKDNVKVVYATKDSASLQKVTNKNVYEYISNHEGAGTISKDSTIYFGLTPAKAGNNYYLATFDYIREDKKNSSNAVYISFGELKPKLTEGTLKSIVICSNLITKVKNGSGLYIFGDAILTEGLIIAKAGSIQATDKDLGYGLDLRSVSLKADIINYGAISVSSKGGIAVRIASSESEEEAEASKSFGLLPPKKGTTARFKNYGVIQQENNSEAFRIAGAKRNEVDTFELTNYAGAEILGSLRLIDKSTIKFDVINLGRIDAPSVNVTNYTGKELSELSLLIKSADSPIVTCSNNFSLEKGAKIFLDPDDDFTKSGNFTIVQAVSGSIDLHGQQVADILYTQVDTITIDGKDTSLKYIEATVNSKDNKQITANLTAKNTPVAEGAEHYMPNMVEAVGAGARVTAFIKTANAIGKAVEDKIEIAGISNNNIKKLTKENNKIFELAIDYNNSADEFFDILLPDSSNSQVINNNKVANKLMDQVAARIAGKSMVAVKTGASKAPAPTSTKMSGITSGDIAENISIWTGFNYLQSTTKKNDKKQSSSKLSAMVFSFGADSQLAYHDITLGASYGFSNSNNKVQGGSSGMSMKELAGMLGEEDIKTHAFTIYSAMGIQQVDAQLALSFGFAKHEPKDKLEQLNKKYNSSIMGVNIAATYPVDLEDFDIDITGCFGVNIINTDKHFVKYMKDQQQNEEAPKTDNSLVYLGLMAAITDVVDLNSDLSLDYKLGLGAKYTISSDKKSKLDIVKGTSIEYNKRQVSPFDFNIDANFNLQIQKNTHLGLDLNLGMGKDSTDFGVATSIRYMF